jgi:tRNA threonylcarbamoyladenosine biosynthesis protein TsaE
MSDSTPDASFEHLMRDSETKPAHPPLVPPRADHGALAMNEAELRDWGHRFGRSAHPPLVITITGELGAGKTTLVQAICSGYGVTQEVTSPTFALVHEYAAPRSPVHHLDLYRLDRPAQLDDLGWDELISAHALVLVEWPERAGERLPGRRVTLSLQHLPDEPDRRLLYAGWRS